MLLKNVSKKKLLSIFFTRLILDGFAALRYLSQGHVTSFFMVIKAHFTVYANIKSILDKREIKEDIPPYYRHNCLPWHYFILRKGKFSDL